MHLLHLVFHRLLGCKSKTLVRDWPILRVLWELPIILPTMRIQSIHLRLHLMRRVWELKIGHNHECQHEWMVLWYISGTHWDGLPLATDGGI